LSGVTSSRGCRVKSKGAYKFARPSAGRMLRAQGHAPQQPERRFLFRDALAGGSALLLFILGGIAALDAAGAFYAAYQRASMRLDDELWLLNNCRDPVFFSKMRAHTSVCDTVEANARVGAVWSALRDVSSDLRAWLRASLQPWILAGCFCCAILALLALPLCCAATRHRGARRDYRLSLPRFAPLAGGGVSLCDEHCKDA